MQISFLRNWVVMVFLAMNLVQISSAREWVSVYGRALIADFVSATETDVTLTRLSDKKEFIIPLSTLSDIDQKWVADHKGEADPTKDPTQPKTREPLDYDWGWAQSRQPARTHTQSCSQAPGPWQNIVICPTPSTSVRIWILRKSIQAKGMELPERSSMTRKR